MPGVVSTLKVTQQPGKKAGKTPRESEIIVCPRKRSYAMAEGKSGVVLRAGQEPGMAGRVRPGRGTGRRPRAPHET
jgi:hypothetical protein